MFVLQKSVMNSMVNKDVETKSTYYESGQHTKRSESRQQTNSLQFGAHNRREKLEHAVTTDRIDGKIYRR